MNLIEDEWIPARRRSGEGKLIAPWQLTDHYDDDPFIRLAAPRPDFNGALIQFLIGLLQTCYAPENAREWRLKYRQPPREPELKKTLAAIGSYFELDGATIRFMQDLTLREEVDALGTKEREDRIKPIGNLLIDIPTGKTLWDNTDLFVKRDQIKSLCASCAAAALFTLQTNAPSGGQGHRTGIRGGGPLTTLILSDTLWTTCWLAVLERSSFLRSTGNATKDALSDKFPWLAKTRTSEDGAGTTPEEAHPAQIFWAMPRRIRLLFSDLAGTCGLCNMTERVLVRQYLTKNLGVNYTGSWRHSLSPHIVTQDGSVSPVHPQPGGVGYRHWLGLVQNVDDGRLKREPAAIVGRYLTIGEEDLRLWAFGYDMDNMKARCWFDCQMPVLVCEAEIKQDFIFSVSAIVKAAGLAASELRRHIRKVLFKPGIEAKGDLSFITGRFWQETEPGFFALISHLRDALQKREPVPRLLKQWQDLLVHTAEMIFNDVSQNGAFDAADPKRIALAWRGLRMGLFGKKMKQTLGLPDEVRSSVKSKGRRKANV